MNNIYYLNNDGSRWVIRPNNTQFEIELYPSREKIIRKAKYFYSFGNFVGIAFSYKGKIKTSLNYKERN